MLKGVFPVARLSCNSNQALQKDFLVSTTSTGVETTLLQAYLLSAYPYFLRKIEFVIYMTSEWMRVKNASGQ